DWMIELLGPVMIGAGQRRYLELGLDEGAFARALPALEEMLASRGPSTRNEIVEQLARRGMKLEGQARPHLLGRAAFEGLTCHGPRRGSEPTYVLLRDWLGDRRASTRRHRDQALAELARRYLGSHGPAALIDFATWSGLPRSDANAAWRSIAG